MHLADWPVKEEEMINPELEANMELIKGIVERVSNLRQLAKLKTRWPLKRIIVQSSDENEMVEKAISSLRKILVSQTNCSAIFITETKPEGEYIYSCDWEHGSIHIDSTIDEDIKARGYSRDIVRRVQQMRKKAKFEVEDWIKLELKLDEELSRLILKDYVCKETRAKEIIIKKHGEILNGVMVDEWEIEGKKVGIGVEKK